MEKKNKKKKSGKSIKNNKNNRMIINENIVYIILVIVCAIFLVFSIKSLLQKKSEKNINKNIEITSSNCKLLNYKDTHGGFLGDGEFFATLDCLDFNSIELSNNWKTLPLTESIMEVLDTKFCNSDGCNDFYERFSVPEINNGYYFFLDRHSDSVNKYSAYDINDRSSYNFTLAIYNTDTNLLYYYELDT